VRFLTKPFALDDMVAAAANLLSQTAFPQPEAPAVRQAPAHGERSLFVALALLLRTRLRCVNPAVSLQMLPSHSPSMV